MSEVTTAAPPATATAPATSAPPAPTSSPAPAAPAAPVEQKTWTSELPDELKGYVQTKGFKDPAAVLESYRNFEKLHGVPADRLIRLPETLEGAEARAIFEKLGRPHDAKDYSIKVEEFAGGQELGEWFRSIADRANWTQKQLDSFVDAWNERSKNWQTSETEKAEATYIEQEQSLKRSWGLAYDQNINLAKQGALAIGLSPENVDALEAAMGYEKTMLMLHKLGSATGESKFVSGQSAGGVMSADAAKAKIQELMGDSAFIRRYSKGDAEARRQMDHLHQAAYPGMTPL